METEALKHLFKKVPLDSIVSLAHVRLYSH